VSQDGVIHIHHYFEDDWLYVAVLLKCL